LGQPPIEEAMTRSSKLRIKANALARKRRRGQWARLHPDDHNPVDMTRVMRLLRRYATEEIETGKKANLLFSSRQLVNITQRIYVSGAPMPTVRHV